MAAPATQSGSKASKKKDAHAHVVERVNSPAPSAGSGAPADSHDEGFESPYIKELQKNIRNLNKKIANVSKTDSILAQHAGKSLEELVAAKVINADQRAQIQKKPALTAQLAQAEEQLAQYQKVHDQYRARATAETAEWEKSLEKAKAEAVTEAKAEFQKSAKENLLVLSQFLRLASHRREEDSDPESDETQAIEGALLAIYAGDESAVSSMMKLMEGSEDKIVSVPGEMLQTNWATVKTLAQEHNAPFYNDGLELAEGETGKEATDSTVASAVATEMVGGDASVSAEKQALSAVSNGLGNANVSDGAANAAAEGQWDTENGLSASQEWVDVSIPRDPTETESGLTATPAAATNTQSWADDQPEPAKQAGSADSNDGFHQVQRNKGRQDREGGGNWRGRGRGEHRGRGGHRGDGRGRGRGRGGMPQRPRRNEES